MDGDDEDNASPVLQLQKRGETVVLKLITEVGGLNCGSVWWDWFNEVAPNWTIFGPFMFMDCRPVSFKTDQCHANLNIYNAVQDKDEPIWLLHYA